jgi:hypothetical protein
MNQETPALATVIRYSTFNLLGYLLVCVALDASAIHLLQTQRPLSGGALIFGVLLGIGSPFVIWRQLWLLFHNQPQLTISAQGIRLAAGPLDAWESIQEEEVRKVRRIRSTDTILYYQAGRDERRLNIRELAISASQLTQLLHHYRAQSLAQRD